jgi:hypothetical protein
MSLQVNYPNEGLAMPDLDHLFSTLAAHWNSILKKCDLIDLGSYQVVEF